MLDMESILLKKAAKGDIDAFEKLISKYEGLIYNVAYRKMSNQEDANDMAQETLIKIYKNIDKCADMKNFKSWICAITVNTCIDELRRRKNKQVESIDSLYETDEGELEKQLKSSELTPEQQFISNEVSQGIQEAINTLSEKHKTLIILRDMQGFSYQEIADVTGDNLGTVKSGIARARNSLKKILMTFKEQ